MKNVTLFLSFPLIALICSTVALPQQPVTKSEANPEGYPAVRLVTLSNCVYIQKSNEQDIFPLCPNSQAINISGGKFRMWAGFDAPILAGYGWAKPEPAKYSDLFTWPEEKGYTELHIESDLCLSGTAIMGWSDVLGNDGKKQCSKNPADSKLFKNPYELLKYQKWLPSQPGLERLKTPSDPQDAQNLNPNIDTSASNTTPFVAGSKIGIDDDINSPTRGNPSHTSSVSVSNNDIVQENLKSATPGHGTDFMETMGDQSGLGSEPGASG